MLLVPGLRAVRAHGYRADRLPWLGTGSSGQNRAEGLGRPGRGVVGLGLGEREVLPGLGQAEAQLGDRPVGTGRKEQRSDHACYTGLTDSNPLGRDPVLLVEFERDVPEFGGLNLDFARLPSALLASHLCHTSTSPCPPRPLR